MKKIITGLKAVSIIVFAFGIYLIVTHYYNGNNSELTSAPAVPAMSSADEEENADLIKRGKELMIHTDTELPENVGNTMSCISCHASGEEAGSINSLNLIGVSKTYPQFNVRDGKIVSLDERINGCFVRSMNGKPLPEDSTELKAMVAYIDFISKNVPEKVKERDWALQKLEGDLPEPNIEEGEKLFNTACISCHATDAASENGLAVWGDDSYNDGAGMNRIRTIGAFIKNDMPKAQMGNIKPGSLTTEQAVNLAAYINSHDRPFFKDKHKDYPGGQIPDDLMYEVDSIKDIKNKDNEK